MFAVLDVVRSVKRRSTVHLRVLGRVFTCLSLWGKFGGLHACGATFSYIVPLPNSLANPFIFKSEIEKEGLPRGSAPALGAGGRMCRVPEVVAAIFRETGYAGSFRNAAV